MLNACATKFDAMKNLKEIAIFFKTKQGINFFRSDTKGESTTKEMSSFFLTTETDEFDKMAKRNARTSLTHEKKNLMPRPMNASDIIVHDWSMHGNPKPRSCLVLKILCKFFSFSISHQILAYA